jgi:hypothetical protein
VNAEEQAICQSCLDHIHRLCEFPETCACELNTQRKYPSTPQIGSPEVTA